MNRKKYAIVWMFFGLLFLPFSNVYGKSTISLGARYDIFSDDQSPEGSGHEITLPLGIIAHGNRWLLRIETAYSKAAVEPDAEMDADISSLTDTLIAGSYTFPQLPVGVVVGFDLNLPTGKERLSTDEMLAEAGQRHDLFEVDNFGEGLNAGVNMSLSKEFGPVNVGFSGAYIFKEEYDSTTETSGDDLDPGDQFLLFTLLKWKARSWLLFDTLLAYSHFGTDTTNGEDSFQEGDKFVFSETFQIRRLPYEVRIGVQNTLQKNNNVLEGDSLDTEAENSNGTEWYGLLDFTYRYSEHLDLQILGDFRYYGESERKNEADGAPYEGKRIRYSIGPGVTYVLNEHFTGNMIAKFFLMDQEQDLTHNQDISYSGANLSMGITYAF